MQAGSSIDWASSYGALWRTPLQAIDRDWLAPDHPARSFETYWRSLAGAEGLPPRSALDPSAVKQLLKWLMIIEVSDTSRQARFTVRLHGTGVAAMMHADFTGLDMRAFTAEESFSSRREAMLSAIERGEPVFARSRVQASDGPEAAVGLALFPFYRDDGSGYHIVAVAAPEDPELRAGL